MFLNFYIVWQRCESVKRKNFKIMTAVSANCRNGSNIERASFGIIKFHYGSFFCGKRRANETINGNNYDKSVFDTPFVLLLFFCRLPSKRGTLREATVLLWGAWKRIVSWLYENVSVVVFVRMISKVMIYSTRMFGRIKHGAVGRM